MTLTPSRRKQRSNHPFAQLRNVGQAATGLNLPELNEIHQISVVPLNHNLPRSNAI